MRRIIIHGFIPKFRSFIVAIRDGNRLVDSSCLWLSQEKASRPNLRLGSKPRLEPSTISGSRLKLGWPVKKQKEKLCYQFGRCSFICCLNQKLHNRQLRGEEKNSRKSSLA